MNKFLKITLLAALAMVLLGAVLSLAGKAAGGRYQVDEMYYNNELNIPFTGYNYNNWNVSEEDSVGFNSIIRYREKISIQQFLTQRRGIPS